MRGKLALVTCTAMAAIVSAGAARAQTAVNGTSPDRPGATQGAPDATPGGLDGPASSPGDTAAEEIIVTGIRASQRQAIDIKRAAINSVDAIATEDLGKLPDQNVAESLQRLPGVTIDRNRGVGNGVTIRGLGPQFNTVTVNGRVIATDSAGREFNFDLLPAELIAGASVYKSPQANINGSSIGATVDIKTLRPLEQQAGLRGGGSARLNYAELSDKATPSAALYGTWRNEAGTLGASLVVAYDDRNERTDNFAVGASSSPRSFDDGYYGSVTNNNGALCVGTVANGVCQPRIDLSKVTLFRNVDMYHNFAQQVEFLHRRRIGGAGTVQYVPTEHLVLTLDALYSRNKAEYYGSGIVPDFSGGTLVNQTVVGGADTTEIVGGQPRTVHVGGTALAESFTNGTVDEIIESRPGLSTTTQFGFNGKWDNGPLTVALDVDRSQARFRNADALFTTVRLKQMDYTYDRQTGSPLPRFDVFNPNYPDAATNTTNRLAHYVGPEGQDYTDTIYEGRLDAQYRGDAVTAYGGGGYSQRTKATTGYTEDNQCAYCGSDVVLPSSLFTPTDYNWFGGRAGGNTSDWVKYDTGQLYQTMFDLNSTADPALHNGSLGPIRVDPAGSSEVREKVAFGYVMLEFKGDLGALPLAVNAGVRVEDTRFTSTGAGQTVVSAQPNGTGQNIIVLSGLTPLQTKGHYTDILPSLNARLNLTDALVFRAAASRVISRPTLTDLSSAQSITSNPGNERITRGNPNLLPFRASQAEAGLEWYYDPDSLLSATFFYKSIDSFITRGVSTQQVDQVSFIIDQPVNGKGAEVKGIELSYRTAFKFLPGLLDGLGTQLSYTYTSSNAEYTNPARASASYSLQGLSKNSYTAVGFYERGPIQARLSYTWRDSYLVAPQTQTGVPEFSGNYGQLDAGLQISLTDNLILTANGINLTDSKEFTYANVPLNTQQYRMVGRRYTGGIRVRF
ncbi:TonB-dependent receptor [Sphingomonas sp. RHCKR7]|uniref:TonB-dependent receptor n=1 Tax=Sphingomonas folli TaxID=2862497 RepID=UPI001CA56C5D|nr:TonB-dependent receptor [Sphingomonas folli]MBW6526487.1 TonB-dependent receptor [Sphingomonas folli]